MNDVREQILARIAAVLATVVPATYRNNGEAIPESAAAFCLLNDGDESADPAQQARDRRARAPRILTMTPEITVFDTAAGDDQVGTALNTLRAQIIKAVLTDAPLLALAKDEGVRYDGLDTMSKDGRRIVGVVVLRFAVDYVLTIADLQ